MVNPFLRYHSAFDPSNIRRSNSVQWAGTSQLSSNLDIGTLDEEDGGKRGRDTSDDEEDAAAAAAAAFSTVRGDVRTGSGRPRFVSSIASVGERGQRENKYGRGGIIAAAAAAVADTESGNGDGGGTKGRVSGDLAILSATSHVTWSCPSCTVENSTRVRNCPVCGTVRPMQPSTSRRNYCDKEGSSIKTKGNGGNGSLGGYNIQVSLSNTGLLSSEQGTASTADARADSPEPLSPSPASSVVGGKQKDRNSRRSSKTVSKRKRDRSPLTSNTPATRNGSKLGKRKSSSQLMCPRTFRSSSRVDQEMQLHEGSGTFEAGDSFFLVL